MSINNLSDITMSHFTSRRKERVASALNISWPIESGRDAPALPVLSPPLTAYSTRPNSSGRRSSLERHSINDSSWYSEMCTPDLSDSSSRRESDSSSVSACGGEPPCMEQSLVDSDKLPSQETLDLAGEIEIVDGNGKARTFKSLYEGSDAIGEQQLVIFIRHFFCGACQGYLKAIHRTISMKQYFSLPVPTSITIIGLGDPKLIQAYRQSTGTKFPIYTDPSRRLHRLLGMTWSLSLGKRPGYVETGVIKGQKEVAKQTTLWTQDQKKIKNKGGSFWWVGGEFLIKDCKVVWCHRMKNYRDHTEVDKLKALLGVDPAV